MTAILLVLIAAIAACIIFDKTLAETVPVAVFAVTLIVYAFSLVLPLNVAVWICFGIVIAVCLGVFAKRRGKPAGIKCLVVRPELIIPVIICAILCVLMYSRHVFFFDDLSYWALYTKNIFSIDKLPRLYENCSVNYKDYTPIIQIVQYIAMFGRSVFSESSMFRTNVCLIYVLLLPVLSETYRTTTVSDGAINDHSAMGTGSKLRITPVQVAATVLYVIFPHSLTAQFYYRLGVDLFVALTFGYALYYIFLYRGRENASDDLRQPTFMDITRDEMFRLVAIALSLAFLALIKTSGIVLCIFAIVFLTIWELKLTKTSTTRHDGSTIGIWIRTAIIAAITLGSYFSWQLFLHYSWNNGYLSNRVRSGMTGGGFSFPEYTGEVVINYIVHFFTYPLTRNRIGVTAFVLVLFIIATAMTKGTVLFDNFCDGTGAEGVGSTDNAGNSDSNANKKLSKRTVPFVTFLTVLTLAGLLLFCLAHLSMYLFVFDEWEAHGLMEFDRYIMQYLGGAFMLYVCLLIRVCVKSDAGLSRQVILLYVSTVIFIVLLPYADMRTYLKPSNYDAVYESEYGEMAQSAKDEWDDSGIAALNLPHDGTAKITAVADEFDETTQFIEYTATPQPINRIVNVPAVEPGRLNGFIMESVDEYVYVFKNAPDAYTGDWTETAELTENGQPLVPGGLYLVDRTNDDKTLRIIE